jgi:hypothetical protein
LDRFERRRASEALEGSREDEEDDGSGDDEEEVDIEALLVSGSDDAAAAQDRVSSRPVLQRPKTSEAYPSIVSLSLHL